MVGRSFAVRPRGPVHWPWVPCHWPWVPCHRPWVRLHWPWVPGHSLWVPCRWPDPHRRCPRAPPPDRRPLGGAVDKVAGESTEGIRPISLPGKNIAIYAVAKLIQPDWVVFFFYAADNAEDWSTKLEAQSDFLVENDDR